MLPPPRCLVLGVGEPHREPVREPIRKPIGKLVGQRFRAQRHEQCRPPSKELPDTGGIPLAPLLSVGALVLLAGSGVFAARLTR